MGKHKLRVWPPGFGPPGVVTFRCEKCLKYIDLPRLTLENILLHKNPRLEHVDFSKWKVCAR